MSVFHACSGQPPYPQACVIALLQSSMMEAKLAFLSLWLLRLLLVPVGIVKRMTFEFCLLRSLSPGRLALTYVFYSSPAVFFGGEGGILENLLGGLCVNEGICD